MTEPSIAATAATIASIARIYVELRGMSPEAALRQAAEASVASSRAAAARTGIWVQETPTEVLEAAWFQGAVAQMILDGASVPSVGSVGEYALGLV